MTDTVKMPEPVIRDMEPYCEPTGFTKDQMQQYGDDRARAGYKEGWNECMKLFSDHMKRINEALAKEIK